MKIMKAEKKTISFRFEDMYRYGIWIIAQN